jgi:hypothetical protein
MAKYLDHLNKGNPTKKVQAGDRVSKEPRNTASGFSLTPKLKVPSEAMEA